VNPQKSHWVATVTSAVRDEEDVSSVGKQPRQLGLLTRIPFAPVVIENCRKRPVPERFVDKAMEHEIATGKFDLLRSRALRPAALLQEQ
jgi:hypothetical protein